MWVKKKKERDTLWKKILLMASKYLKRIFNIISHYENANLNHNGYHYTPIIMANIKYCEIIKY